MVDSTAAQRWKQRRQQGEQREGACSGSDDIAAARALLITDVTDLAATSPATHAACPKWERVCLDGAIGAAIAAAAIAPGTSSQAQQRFESGRFQCRVKQRQAQSPHRH